MAELTGVPRPENLLPVATSGIAYYRAVDVDGRSVKAGMGEVNLANRGVSPDNSRAQNTSLIQAALDYCRDNGYSWYLPPGDYKTGPVTAYTSGRGDGRLLFDNNPTYQHGLKIVSRDEDIINLDAAFVNSLTIVEGGTQDTNLAPYYGYVLSLRNTGDEVPIIRANGATLRWHENIIVHDPGGIFYPPYADSKTVTWTDAFTDAKAYRIRECVVVSGLTIVVENDGVGGMNSCFKNSRPNVVFKECAIFSESTNEILQGFISDAGGSIIRWRDCHVKGLRENNTNYGWNVTASDILIDGCTEIYCRRGFDAHNAKLYRVRDSSFPDGGGGHWVHGMHISGTYLSVDPPDAAPINVGGGDVVVTDCHIVVSNTTVSLMQIRGDIFEWKGHAVLDKCLIEFDCTDILSTRRIIVAGASNAGNHDWGRTVSLPDNIRITGCIIRQKGASFQKEIVIYEPFGDSGTPPDGYHAGGQITVEGNTWELEAGLTTIDSNPRVALFITKVPAWVSGGYSISISDVPCLWPYLACNPAHANMSTPRVDLYTSRIPGELKYQANYGIIRYARIGGENYSTTIGSNRPAVGASIPKVGDEHEVKTGILYATDVWNTGTVANSANATKSITIPGVKVGDVVSANLSTAGSGWVIGGRVTATNTVVITAINLTGGSAGTGSGLLNVTVNPA